MSPPPLPAPPPPPPLWPPRPPPRLRPATAVDRNAVAAAATGVAALLGWLWVRRRRAPSVPAPAQSAPAPAQSAPAPAQTPVQTVRLERAPGETLGIQFVRTAGGPLTCVRTVTGSPARRAGVPEGALLLQMSGRHTATGADLAAAVTEAESAGKPLDLAFARGSSGFARSVQKHFTKDMQPKEPSESGSSSTAEATAEAEDVSAAWPAEQSEREPTWPPPPEPQPSPPPLVQSARHHLPPPPPEPRPEVPAGVRQLPPPPQLPPPSSAPPPRQTARAGLRPRSPGRAAEGPTVGALRRL
eukprot:TRINITY_DN2846_c0_g1_i6.p2 TRINITY_DN2846_c0_g1~~TRINITY_DN2846_c0_g1_i6.p2  ORF type:complete len:300 (+),score=74.23 TRINITY_DN2846_c0_g1_i6:848-1747(+)